MMNNKILTERLMESPKIRNLGLREDAVMEILRAYNKVATETLLENGTLNLGNGLTIDVVQLLDRVHMLRGVPYQNTRKYKLKLTLDDETYDKIEAYYNQLKQDIM